MNDQKNSANCYPIGDGHFRCLPNTASRMDFAILAAEHVEYLKTKNNNEQIQDTSSPS